TVLVTHSVEEAVLLSNRVIVLSPHPARIIADVTVELEGERTADLTRSAAFRALTSRVMSSLDAA
ncbi:MAG: ABC transporter ATP-binding protein, partial [Paracoccaceae bacterium]